MPLKIYYHSLREGDREKIDIKLPPDFMDVREKELSFADPVLIKGEVYVTEDLLVFQCCASTFATIPCAVCNEPVKIPLTVTNLYHPESVEKLKAAYVDFAPLLREDILLQIPVFAECNNGNCPERATLKKFLKNHPDEQFPFSGL